MFHIPLTIGINNKAFEKLYIEGLFKNIKDWSSTEGWTYRLEKKKTKEDCMLLQHEDMFIRKEITCLYPVNVLNDALCDNLIKNWGGLCSLYGVD